MEIDIYNADAELSSLIELLVEEKEKVIYLSKDGKPIAQLTLIKNENKRVGGAKEEMAEFDISLEDFNSISTDF